MSFHFNLHGSTGKGVSNPGIEKLAFPSPRKCIQSSFDAFAALREDGSVVSWGDRSFNHLMAGRGKLRLGSFLSMGAMVFLGAALRVGMG